MAENNLTDTPDSVPVESEGDSNILMAVIGILSFFSVLGSVGNAMVLYVYVRKRNKLASTVFIITLAFTDFLTCIVIIPYTVVLEYMNYYLKYDFLCKFYMFLITSNVPFSAFIMVGIAVDRYLCICHPFTHILNAKRAKCVIFWLGTIAFTLGVITSLNYGVYFPVTNTVVNQTNWVTEEFAIDFDVVNDTFFQNTNTSLSKGIFYNHSQHQLNSLLNNYKINVTQLKNTGICRPNELIFTKSFTVMYQKLYSSFFMIVLVAVVILYIMIYRFVTSRRARRQRMRSQRSGYSSCKEVENSYVQTRASISNGCVKTEVEPTDFKVGRCKSEKPEMCRQLTIREKGLVANIRTAGMLFVVTAVFIVVFLPAWLMAHQVIPYNMLVFYMYFFYNVANPIVYAFMNKAFRRDLRDVLECRKV